MKTTDHNEIELKFELDADAAAGLRRHHLLGRGHCHKSFQRTVYFDTDDGRLRKNGYSLRVRQVGRRFTQTVKTTGCSAGQFDREEWESSVRSLKPDPSALEKTPLAQLDGFDRLQPIARFDVNRTSWPIRFGGNALEVVLDCGEVTAGGHSAPLRELELELKDGEASALFAIARRLSHPAPLPVGVLSKQERGMMLARRQLGRAQKASRVRIRQKMDVRQAVAAVVSECIRHFRLNESAIIEHRNPEAVHQARVALRRLRAAFSFFDPAIRDRSLDPFRKALKDLATLFGKARDIDVFLASHQKYLGPADRKKLGQARRKAYDQAIEALGSRQTRELFLDLIEWIAAEKWAKRRARKPISDFAAKRLNSAWKRIKRKASKLPEIDEKPLHRLRISIKKLRYALEFMASLYSRKDMDRFVSSLEEIQDGLGQLHDEVNNRRLIDGLSLEFSPGADGLRRSQCLKEAEAEFKALKRMGMVWSK